MAPLGTARTTTPSSSSPLSISSSPNTVVAGVDQEDPSQSADAADLFVLDDESAAVLGIPTGSAPFHVHHGLVGDGSGSASKSNDAVPSSYYPTAHWAFPQTTPPYESPYETPVAKFPSHHHNQHQNVIFSGIPWDLSSSALVAGPGPGPGGAAAVLDHNHHHPHHHPHQHPHHPHQSSLSPPIPSSGIASSNPVAATAAVAAPPLAPPPRGGPRRNSPSTRGVSASARAAAAAAAASSTSGHRSSSSPELAQQPHLPQGAFNFGPEALHILTPSQQEHLRNIAMPVHLQYHSPKSEPSPVSSTSDTHPKLGGGVASSPEAGVLTQLGKASRKRKATATDLDDDDDDDDEIDQPVKKTAHNMIEKRYRNNLNDKIAALRDSVPSLRIMSKSARGEDTTEDREELHGLTPAHKLNKATILSKATEYIRHLEKRNARLIDENETMQARITAFEKLVMGGAMPGIMGPAQPPPTPMQYQADSMSYMNTPLETPARDNAASGGMMSQPMQAQQFARPQQPFAPNPAMIRQQQLQKQQQQQHQHQHAQQSNNRWINAGPYFGKLMVGSLAGLMMLEAIRENEASSETTEGRGLFAVPVHLLGMVRNSMHVNFMGHHIPAHTVIHYLKVLFFAGVFLWIFVPSLFINSKPPSKPKATTSLGAAPSLASPIAVRRQAWLTAIQTVWVPHNNYILEAAALSLKTLKLSLRNAIGIIRYQALTGLTSEQEEARVQAWSIALDAQLAGGDVEINKSRLTLTLLASKTLPDTPQRLMMQALHIRVLFWDLAKLGLVNMIAAKLARTRWNEARQLHRLLSKLRKESPQQQQAEEELPDHLAALLEQECDIVLNDAIIQRAHNLAWHHDTDRDVKIVIDGMNAVVDDTAVRSPLDAVAAWWCCQTVHNALITSLEAASDDEEARQAIEDNIKAAVRAAPIGSAVQTRVLVARAVLVSKFRGASIAAALKALGTGQPDSPLIPYTPTTPLSRSPDSSFSELRAALRAAMALGFLHRAKASGPVPRELSIVRYLSVLAPSNSSFLVCTALYHVVEKLFEHPEAAEIYSCDIERLSGGLRLWIGGPAGEDSGMPSDLRAMLVEACLDITKTIMGLEVDTGYGSGSEEGEQEQQLPASPQQPQAISQES